ncbi:RNA transcription, translation and transport factor protein [Tetranychus urticae]|uniref:RNA transcription, translation and transport factor protein n=1 Tax=Tetranychus urticae TaxID=32264 RepID=T1K580_TETUR|nr:RNA transcription, translation and transport factor protein [Tetranychus urticae]
MFSRKLKAIEFGKADNFNVEDENSFRNLVAWLEDQKIRHYPIEERSGLRKISSPDWENAFKKYLESLKCPFDVKDRKLVLDWLISTAVRLDYNDNFDKYKDVTGKLVKNQASNPQMVQANPLDNLDFNAKEFKHGIGELAKLLKVPQHPDHLITLKAINHLIKTRLTADALQSEKEELETSGEKSFTLENSILGFDVKDQNLSRAAKVLRILYINDLRDLQNKINQVIVSIQAITANPKTDTSLGQVGR